MIDQFHGNQVHFESQEFQQFQPKMPGRKIRAVKGISQATAIIMAGPVPSKDIKPKIL